jgi:hypothetical protein
MASTLISDSDYEVKYLTDLAQIVAFCKDKEPQGSVNVEDFGPFSRKRFSGALESEFLRFTDGSILTSCLFGEHHYSEDTMDEATIVYTGWTFKRST